MANVRRASAERVIETSDKMRTDYHPHAIGLKAVSHNEPRSALRLVAYFRNSRLLFMVFLGYEEANLGPDDDLMLTTLFILSLLGAPTPRDLLLDIQAQADFVREHAPGFVRVHFKQPMAKELEPTFQPESLVLGTLVEMDGEARVLVPTHRVSGVLDAEIELADGRRLAAEIESKKDDGSIPFKVVRPKEPKALKGEKTLSWVAEKSPETGLMLWAVEWPIGQQLPNSKARPILIRTTLGERVEPPLDRFYYADIGRADGLALLTHAGAIQCLVFRAVPATKRKSLCAPQGAVLTHTGTRK